MREKEVVVISFGITRQVRRQVPMQNRLPSLLKTFNLPYLRVNLSPVSVPRQQTSRPQLPYEGTHQQGWSQGQLRGRRNR